MPIRVSQLVNESGHSILDIIKSSRVLCGCQGFRGLRDNGEDTGATKWCESDMLMSCSFACATCNDESRCDAQPSPGLPCEWGCSDDLRGNASCNEEPIEQLCREATCAAGVSCTLSIEGTGTCDSPPAGGYCSCDDGQWSCMTSCPEACPSFAPTEGDPCETDELTCRYYYDGTLHCTDGAWST